MKYTKTPQEFYGYLIKAIIECEDSICKGNVGYNQGQKDAFQEVLDCCLKKEISLKDQVKKLKEQADFIKGIAEDIERMK